MDGTLVECKSCGNKDNEWMVNKRNHLAKHNKLITGKTK